MTLVFCSSLLKGRQDPSPGGHRLYGDAIAQLPYPWNWPAFSLKDCKHRFVDRDTINVLGPETLKVVIPGLGWLLVLLFGE